MGTNRSVAVGAVCALVVASVLLVAAPADAGVIYAALFNTNRIASYDSDTGAPINSFAPPFAIQTGGGVGLALSPTTLFYSTISNPQIYALNPFTGGLLGNFPSPVAQIDGLGAGPSSFGPTLYAQDYNGNRIYLLNPATGAVYTNYTVPFDAIGGIDYDTATNELYVSDSAGILHALNPNTGVEIHSLNVGGTFGVGFVGPRLFTANSGTAITERNPVTGTAINTLNAAGNVAALAGSALFPEPGSIALVAGIPLLAMRRRANHASRR